MQDLFWTAIRIPAVIDPNSEYGVMYERFEQPTELVNSDGVKFSLFVTSVDSPIDAIYPVLTEDKTTEDVFTEILAHLTDEVKSVVLTKGLASQLYNEFVAPTLIEEI